MQQYPLIYEYPIRKTNIQSRLYAERFLVFHSIGDFHIQQEIDIRR